MKKNNLEAIRHSLSHLMSMAVQELYPKAGLGVGPAIENGFYQDYNLPEAITPEILPKLEKRIKELIKENIKFEKHAVDFDEAYKFYQHDPYKTELIDDLKNAGEKKVSFYKSGWFDNLCDGPHVNSAEEIDSEAFKLIKIAGAYWRGDEKNKMLTRIYGLAFENKKELDGYLKQMEEAGKRDHKRIGRELDLFSFHSEAPGSAFWHPKGMIIWNELENLGKSIRKKYGYLEIQTPILAKKNLWETSGHWNHYKDVIYHFDADKETYCLKPMDCPFNIKIYQTKQRSYKELPIRYTEIGRILRNEKSGELNGLLRVRHLTQDDSHIFLTKDQVENEISILLKMVGEYYLSFGISPEFFLSTRPKDFMGEEKDWKDAEKNLENALKKEGIKFKIKEKDGAFYGPKIDIDMRDALGRSWQLATIQLDFQLPARFKMEYIDKDGKKKAPVIIHAAIFGAFERFIGIILEHFGGNLPLWLSPVQIEIIPVSEKFNKYAEEVYSQLSNFGIRVNLSSESQTLGKRISEAEKQKIPYILVVGEKEEKSKSVAVRSRESKQEITKLDKFIEKVKKEIAEKE